MVHPWLTRESAQENNGAFFIPPLHSQRKHFIAQYVRDNIAKGNSLVTLLDVGCGEGALLQYLKLDHVYERLVGIDRDGDLLRTNTVRAVQPSALEEKVSHGFGIDLLHADVIHLAQHEMRQECHNTKNNKLALWEKIKWLQSRSFDVCVCTEMMEHVHLGEELAMVEQFLFQVTRARAVIVTTPNHDFNGWFEERSIEEEGKHTSDAATRYPFRHDDHKYEFTRNEFEQWTQHVLKTFPHYRLVQSTGVGKGRKGDMSRGYATQIAVFALPEPHDVMSIEPYDKCEGLTKIDYPIDDRTALQRLVDECVRKCFLASSSKPYTIAELCENVQLLQDMPRDQREGHLKMCLGSEYAYGCGFVVLDDAQSTVRIENDYDDDYDV